MEPKKPRIKTVCCECQAVIHDGPVINGRVSHGYCQKCAAAILADIERGQYG